MPSTPGVDAARASQPGEGERLTPFLEGAGAHLILDMLMEHQCVNIQWGNYDILWMGAAAGSEACIANVARICLR